MRPTPSRVKESLFAILRPHLEDAVVLDLYAGSGALGFEALSRGAKHATFVDRDAQAIAKLRAIARELGVAGACETFAGAAERVVARLRGPYDIVFVDPPYADGFPEGVLGALLRAGAFAEDAVVIFEHAVRQAYVPSPGFVPVREERYGNVALTFLHPSPEVRPEQS